MIGPAQEQARPTLRVVVCGSVDDGKSTLLGRLLIACGAASEDQLADIARLSPRFGSMGDAPDPALLVDGLEDERAQGVTIDVAHRRLARPGRLILFADAPGHPQYTANMATAASRADCALLLVDIRAGLVEQTFRHAVIAALMGAPAVVLAVNKVDLVEDAPARFASIRAAFVGLAGRLGFARVAALPVCARHGDNLLAPGPHTAWWEGPTLLAALEGIDGPAGQAAGRPLRLPVQWVCRTSDGFRGFAGTIAHGRMRIGDRVAAAHAPATSRIVGLTRAGRPIAQAEAGDAVMANVDPPLEAGRGDVLHAPDFAPVFADQFAARLVWMAAEPLHVGRSYWLSLHGRLVAATVTALKHRLDVTTLQPLAARVLERNEIGLANIALAAPQAFEPYRESRTLGAFLLIDRRSHATAAAGMIDFPLRRATNLHPQSLSVSPQDRARIKNHKPAILWFTGLSGAGKSTIADRLEQRLNRRGVHTALIDGDNLRLGLNRDLGFTAQDRVENVRRAGEVARLMADAGLVTLCAFISPFAAERAAARERAGPVDFFEIFVDVPLETAMARDPKGLYAKARAGTLRNFTGVDQVYEAPLAPDLRLDAAGEDVETLAGRLLDLLAARGVL